jgi:DNA recombination protein RmuC
MPELDSSRMIWMLIAAAPVLGAACWLVRSMIVGARERGRAEREPELAELRVVRDAALERLEATHADLVAHRGELAHAREAIGALQSERVRLETDLGYLTPLRAQLDAAGIERERLRAEALAHAAQVATLEARLEAAQAQIIERQRLLDQTAQQMKLEFQSLAAAMLDEKGRKFTEQNADQLGSLLNPLREQLDGFRKVVAESYEREMRERAGLAKEIESLRTLNAKLGDDATALTKALKGESRTQGAWGEMLLERLLEASGLEAGREYDAQISHLGSDGSRARPDVIVHLPERRDIVIDAKVSLTAYQRFCEASDPAQRDRELAAHLGSMREHVRQLGERRYTALEGVNSLDFVLMFVPVEAAFVEAMRADDGLYRYAIERNVVIVTASTLLATLRTVSSLWRFEDRNRNAIEIADRAGRLYDKFAGFIADMQRLGANLRTTQKTFDEAFGKLSEGQGNLIRQTEELRRLGARAQKALDRDLIERAGAESPALGSPKTPETEPGSTTGNP